MQPPFASVEIRRFTYKVLVVQRCLILCAWSGPSKASWWRKGPLPLYVSDFIYSFFHKIILLIRTIVVLFSCSAALRNRENHRFSSSLRSSPATSAGALPIPYTKLTRPFPNRYDYLSGTIPFFCCAYPFAGKWGDFMVIHRSRKLSFYWGLDLMNFCFFGKRRTEHWHTIILLHDYTKFSCFS